MDSQVKTLLPLITWTMQKVLGPVYKPDEWRAIALSFIPPPDSIVRDIRKESTALNRQILLSPTARRRVRNQYKNEVASNLRDNRMAVSTRDYLVAWKQKIETEGYTFDPSRIRKRRDIETETNQLFSELAESHELGDLLRIEGNREQEAISLLWEFASTGKGGQQLGITKSSPIWRILGIEKEEFEALSEDEIIPWCLFCLQTLMGLGDESNDKQKLIRLLKWVISTHLPVDEEPKTTPRALWKAMNSSLIYPGHQTKDKETGEVKVEDMDPDSTQFIQEVEIKDALDRIAAKVKFTDGERIMFEGMREGLRGESLGSYIKGQGISPSSVRVLTNRVMNKLKAATKS